MIIKSLILGSAVALSAVPVAYAADAIVSAETEPLQYLRICDAYGAGYFYIPGSETCMKIGGMVRSEAVWKDAYQTNPNRGTYWKTRAELDVDTATDTEYGALNTNMIFRFNSAAGVNDSQVLMADIRLGGLLVGKYGSQYNSWIGYAGNVINDDVIGDGPSELNQISYLYDSGNGFTGVISVEDTTSGLGARGPNGEDSSDHYAPDAVVGLGYKAGAFGLKVVGGYDSVVKEGAIKARFDATFGAFTAFLLGQYNTDGSKINRYANGDFGGYDANGTAVKVSSGDWQVWVGTTYKISDKIEWNEQVAYDDKRTFEVTTNVNFFLATGYKIQPSLTYVKYDKLDADVWTGLLRFQRSF